MNEYYVYRIHLPEHTDLFTEGYIGISKRIERRLWEHKNNKENDHLVNAFNRYTNITHTILVKGTKEYCLEIECKLRPTDHIGWNITKGGGLPPDATGKRRSDKTRQKMRESRKTVKFSEEACKNISLAKRKEKHPNWGKSLPIETREKLRISNIGKKRTKVTECEHCGKIVDNANYKKHHHNNCKQRNII